MREHMESDNALDLDRRCTFAPPAYEIMPDGRGLQRARGGDAYYQESRAAFPDQRNDLSPCGTPTTR